MCGRVTLKTTAEELAEFFGLPDLSSLEPRYNIAPTQSVLVIRRLPEKGREVVPLRWGLIPQWSMDATVGNRMINARSETITLKPSFREAFKNRRCLVMADGFYEWQKLKGKKLPFLFRMKDAKPFAFAGLWEANEVLDKTRIETFTILTTSANELVRPLHDRMPVIISPANYDLWLDPNVKDPAFLKPLLQPYPAELMTSIQTNSWVNDPNNEGQKCIAPPDQPEPTLWG